MLKKKTIIILKKDPKVQPMYRIAMRKKQVRNNKVKIENSKSFGAKAGLVT